MIITIIIVNIFPIAIKRELAISIININTTIIIGMIAIITINIKYKTYFLGCMILRLIGICKKPKKGGVN